MVPYGSVTKDLSPLDENMHTALGGMYMQYMHGGSNDWLYIYIMSTLLGYGRCITYFSNPVVI